MKLMIDIPEEDYIRLRDEGMFGNVTTFKRAVRKGIPLEQEPCTDAISRQAAINVAVDAVDDWDGGCNKTREEYIRKALETLPPITPAKKVGHWEWEQESFTKNWGNWHCSECQKIITVCETDWAKINKPVYKYCPDCGAKMQDVEE